MATKPLFGLLINLFVELLVNLFEPTIYRPLLSIARMRLTLNSGFSSSDLSTAVLSYISLFYFTTDCYFWSLLMLFIE